MKLPTYQPGMLETFRVIYHVRDVADAMNAPLTNLVACAGAYPFNFRSAVNVKPIATTHPVSQRSVTPYLRPWACSLSHTQFTNPDSGFRSFLEQ